jgi:predicted AlkP superfamily pyrophosphatase or phosphodiesterase
VRAWRRTLLPVVLALASGTGLGAERARLGVLIVIDQLSAQAFEARAAHTVAGLRRLVAEGAAFDACLYEAAPTVTSVGHATLVTGAWPETHGIVANEWFEAETGRAHLSTEDPAFQVLGRPPGAHDGTAPTWLLAPTLGDSVRAAADGARVVSISGKDRSGILMAGRSGLAVWFDAERPFFTTSTYYAPAVPAWAQGVNARLQQQFARVGLGADADAGAGPVAERPEAQALIDSAEVELALDAVTALKLGQGEAVDLLEVSFSGHDRVGHEFGPDAPEALAEYLHVDREVGRLLDGLDARVGKGRYVVALSSDHGVAPVPERLKARGLDAGRVDPAALRQKLEAELALALGPGAWIVGVRSPGYELAPGLRAKVTPQVVQRLRRVALAEPGVAELLWAADLPTTAGTLAQEQYRRGYVPGRTVDLIVVPRPYWVWGLGDGTSHGTPYLYDRAVPLVFFGAGVKRARLGQAQTIDVAPTLAHLMGVPPPAAARGKALEAVFR